MDNREHGSGSNYGASFAGITVPVTNSKTPRIRRPKTQSSCDNSADETVTQVAYAHPNLLVSSVTCHNGDGHAQRRDPVRL